MTVCLVCVFIKKDINANTITGVMSGNAYKDGKYMYYCVHGGGTRDGLNRINLKTGHNEVLIRNDMSDSHWDNGFYNITVKGKNIYAIRNLNTGTSGDSDLQYIYRISKDGKKQKRLACGFNCIIIGNRIYYEKWKEEKFVWSSMKLDGSDKRNEENTALQIKYSALDIYDLRVVDSDKYTYKLYKKKLERIKNNTRKIFYKAPKGYEIHSVDVSGDAALITLYSTDYSRCKAYIVNGKGKKFFLRQWMAAE